MSCSGIKQTSKYAFNEGVYKVKTGNSKAGKSYVEISDDSLLVYPVRKADRILTIDTLNAIAYSFGAQNAPTTWRKITFTQRTLDLDVLTIFFKYRPAVSALPNQLNTNFNGAFYLGYRSDKYLLTSFKTPLNLYKKIVTHYGYSFGIFSGIGSTAVNPWVTKNKVMSEYDGVVFTNGLSAIIGIDKFTFGLALGLDRLLDKNHTAWIYKNQPWMGLSLGLNLN